MSEIIPAIIAKNFNELGSKTKLVEACVKTVQLDVMDGVFVGNKTWPYFENQSIVDLDNLETRVFLEAHLMVEAPEKFLDEWLASKVGRIIMHYEAVAAPFCHSWSSLESKSAEKMKNPDSHFHEDSKKENSAVKINDFAKKVKNSGKQFGIALNPETPIEVIDNFINVIDLVLLMSVGPGFAGQKFKEEVIHKIIVLRQRHPNVKIEVDGGVNSQNILRLVEAGVDFLVMGSAIFSVQEPCSFINSMSKGLEDR